MREKKRCRWLALLLAVVMVLSVLPTAVFAEVESSTDTFYKIVHLDCGRKYFSPENIKKIIDNAAAAGFNQVELYLSDNQGFRFALDDMNVTTSTGNTYDLTPALGDGYSDGSKYPDGSGKYLTQSEMTDIISYATEKGIDIVPCINVPGHMGAILEEFTQFKYSGSNSSIDLANEEAVAFALAITQKYVNYFKTQGVKYYNIGADEYANDLSSMGFEGMGSTLYTKFVEFLNSAADIILAAGMTPRAFNDGFLYKDYNISVTPNEKYEICYWTSGWGGYDVAAAETLNNAGYKLINTHGDYYWVLGVTNWQCSAEKASGFNYTSFQGGTISDPAGAMFCIWCDVGNANGMDGGTAVVSDTADVIAAFGAALPASEPGGSEGGVTEPTDPTEPVEVTENETITVTAGGTATATISNYNFAGTYTTEDPSIATIEVTGKDAVEATTTYTQTTVTCDTLISSDSNSWTAASGYYYKADNGSYYPVYAKRSSSWSMRGTTYNYTYGYSTDNGNTVTQCGTQQYTKHVWESHQNVIINIYIISSTTEATPASTTVTFTADADAAGKTTYVTVGNTRYTINVVAEDLSEVTPLTVEYWITNLRVTAGGATSKSISAQSAYGEAGVDISTLVPETGTYVYGSVVFWKGTVHDSNNKQTTDSGTEGDKTGSGKDFNLIRYYNGSWQYFYEADGTWNTISSTDQVVIYWLQPTEVTKEITTLTKDWGYDPSNQQGDNESKVALTIAVVYPDGTVSPAEGDMYSTSTTLFNYWSGRDIGLVAPVNNSDYAISKMTVTDGTRDQSGTGQWGANDTITWDKVTNEAGQQWYNETTYWDETVGGTPMVNGVTSNITWSNYNTAKLVLIYLKPVHYDTNLTVKWVDDSAGGALISTMEVAVSSDGTPITFYNGLKQTSALPEVGVGGTFTLDNDAYVTNSSNVNQTFNKNISTVPNVADKYKTGLYQYVSADLSADGKTLTLHYNVKADKTFVYDFGLPMQVNLGALVENADIVNSITFDRSEVVYANGVVTFTPTSAAVSTITTKAAITFDDASTQSMTIAFVPASNVLYEENFMNSVEDNYNYVDWTYTANSITAFTYDAGTVYGYNSAYANCTGANGQYTASVTPAGNTRFTDILSFSFTGTGFDLIGQCGPDTGTLAVRVADSNNKTAKNYLIDTSFKDPAYDTIYQVPLLHCTDLKDGTYTVTISGAYIDYSASANANTSVASTFSMGSVGTSVIDTIYELADRMGLSGDDLDSMEFINVDQLYGASTYAMASAVRTASTGTADTESVATMTLGIDGFRVYRDTGNSAYKTGEKDMVYVNVLDAVANGGKGVYVTSYTENGTEQYEISEYEGLGGPENELYLPKGASVTFNVESAEYIQASLRAVAGATSWNNTSISSNTEMYYSLTAQEQGKYVIVNTGDNLLAIGNLKTNGTVTIVSEELKSKALSLTRMMMAAASEPDPEQPGTEEPEPTPAPVFEPDKFELRTSSIRTRNRRIVTLMITASTDVDHVVVNGKTYYPMNKLLVKWGLSKTYVFTIMDTAGASETRSFEIVAYNADGLASIIYTDAG